MTGTISRRTLLLTSSLISAVALAGCAGERGSGADTAAGSAGGAQQLTLGHGAAPGNPRTIGAETFKELVEEGTDGAITVQILGQETIGSDAEMLTSVQNGSLDMTINSQGPFSTYVPEIALVGLPFLFENSEHAYAVLDGDALQPITDAAEAKGLRVLGYWDNGMRDITNNVRPIEKPEDVEGLKIRTPDDPMTISIFKALGANPTPMAFGELYLALRQGAVDGQENPVVNIKSAKLQEVQKYLAVTGHKYETNPFVVSQSTWDSLSPEHQQVIEDAANEARSEQRSLMAEQSEEIYAEFEELLEVTHPDKDAFREATSGVYDEWSAKHADFFTAITQAAEESRAEFAGGGR